MMKSDKRIERIAMQIASKSHSVEADDGHGKRIIIANGSEEGMTNIACMVNPAIAPKVIPNPKFDPLA